MRSLILALATSLCCSSTGATIINGDFSAGNTGFMSEYVYAPGGNGTEGEFTVRSDPQNWNQAFAPMPDHTSGDGQMLVVNGATAGNPYVWQQTVGVLPATEYSFSAWVASAYPDGPADLIVQINGSTLGSSFTLPMLPGSWENFARVWSSAGNTTAELRIVNTNLSVFPNDFYIDDIAFVAVPEPGMLAMLSGLAASVAVVQLCSKLKRLHRTADCPDLGSALIVDSGIASR